VSDQIGVVNAKISLIEITIGDGHAHKVDVLSQSHRFAEALAKLAAEEN
jgi:hypothetical protein